MKRPLIFFFFFFFTLINHDCDVSWKQFVVKHGLAPESDLAEADRYFDDYNAGTLDVEEFYGFQFREFVGRTEPEMLELSNLHFREFVEPHIYAEGRRLVGSLLRQGSPVAILTSTNSIVARPIAEALGISEVLGTTLELRDGRFTGRITGPYGAREGKVAIAREWAARHGVTLADFAYYGDSVNDVQILEAVGFPNTVNPSGELRRIAEERNWPILNWSGE